MMGVGAGAGDADADADANGTVEPADDALRLLRSASVVTPIAATAAAPAPHQRSRRGCRSARSATRALGSARVGWDPDDSAAIALSSASATSSIDRKRSDGSLARARTSRRSTASGTSGETRLGRVGCSRSRMSSVDRPGVSTVAQG
jgi:hypothetical protein